MPTDEMIPMPPLRLGPADLVELFAAALDRPLFLACREVSCSALYYVHAALCRIEDVVDSLHGWYDHRAPNALWWPEVAGLLDRTYVRVADARHSAFTAWTRITGYWKGQAEPVRFGKVLASFRRQAAREWPLGAQVA